MDSVIVTFAVRVPVDVVGPVMKCRSGNHYGGRRNQEASSFAADGTIWIGGSDLASTLSTVTSTEYVEKIARVK